MNLKISLILILCLTLLAGCGQGKTEKASGGNQESPKITASGNFSIGGAFALSPLTKKLAENFMKINPGVKIEVKETGTGQGISALLSKDVDLAMISRPLTDEEKEAGIWVTHIAKDGVAPIVNRNNPYLHRLLLRGLSPDEFQKVFTDDKQLTWGELLDTAGTEKVIVYSRADESGAAEMLAKFLFRKVSDLKGIKVTGDYAMIKAIQETPLAIGFCNFSFAFDVESGERTENIQVVPFDLDFDNEVDRKEIPFNNLESAHRSLWLGLYPDNLCRDLTLGSLGKPQKPVVVEFIKYILSDGQEEVKNAGLCKLNHVYIRNSLDDLN